MEFFLHSYLHSSIQPVANSENPFKLPIEYLDSDKIRVLNPVVAADLELTSVDASGGTMYHFLMNPKNPFEEKIIHSWKKYYTTDTKFLEETQDIIRSLQTYKPRHDSYELEHDSIMQIWKDTKEDPSFLERYSYMELEMLKWVNTSPSFLQAISVINMGSPILSFLVPFILFLLPFLIVKMQGHKITFSIYMSVLKDVSKNHFIGKMIHNAENMNIQNMVYLFGLIGLYGYQIYQNYIACNRFYSNISRINSHICQLQKYIGNTIYNLQEFRSLIVSKNSYSGFSDSIGKYKSVLAKLSSRIDSVRPFEPSFMKIGEIGTLLGCYYDIHSNPEFAEALLYSFSFHGYIRNMLGIFDNIQSSNIGFATFEPIDPSGNALTIKDQYYPALINEQYVPNDADLTKNMVITGPNAAGKTTFLKTTVLNIIFTQQFGCGFYSSCSIVPYTHIHSYLNIPDTSGRDSLFQAESRRCKEIINDVLLADKTARHFCIFDELYSGTNPAEATKSAYAFLLYLSKRNHIDFILTTHYVDICAKLQKSNRIANWKMDATEDSDGEIVYTYKISKGVSKIQGALKVLKNMEYPAEIIDTIMDWSKKSE